MSDILFPLALFNKSISFRVILTKRKKYAAPILLITLRAPCIFCVLVGICFRMIFRHGYNRNSWYHITQAGNVDMWEKLKNKYLDGLCQIDLYKAKSDVIQERIGSSSVLRRNYSEFSSILYVFCKVSYVYKFWSNGWFPITPKRYTNISIFICSQILLFPSYSYLTW